MTNKAKPTISAENLLAAIALQQEYYDLDGVGTVLIRSLSTNEAQSISQKHGTNQANIVVAVIEKGLLEPKLSPEQINALRESKSGPVTALFERIGELSAVQKTEDLADLAGAGS